MKRNHFVSMLLLMTNIAGIIHESNPFMAYDRMQMCTGASAPEQHSLREAFTLSWKATYMYGPTGSGFVDDCVKCDGQKAMRTPHASNPPATDIEQSINSFPGLHVSSVSWYMPFPSTLPTFSSLYNFLNVFTTSSLLFGL